MKNSELKERWKDFKVSSLSGGLMRKRKIKSPFNMVDGIYQDFRGITIDEDIKKVDMTNIDFTYSSFLKFSRFQECIFKNVLFVNSDMNHFKEHNCEFIECLFENVELNNAKIGYGGSIYRNCIFRNCDFRKISIIKPEFTNCTFENCNLEGVDFNVSYFENCKFIGNINDVWFRGDYAFPTDLKEYGTFRKNEMKNIDFSNTKLSWLTFTDGIPLNAIILPDDKFIIYLENKEKSITEATKRVDQVFNDYKDKTLAIKILNELLDETDPNQTEYIFSLEDLNENYSLNEQFL
ncbi:MAG TPA: pentapeptide repeat-containing protein, partial [Sulfurovum sp.]